MARDAIERDDRRRRLGLRASSIALVVLALTLGACASEPLDSGQVIQILVEDEGGSAELTLTPLDDGLVPRSYLMTFEKERAGERRYYEATILPPGEATREQLSEANTLARAVARTAGPLRSDLAYHLAGRFPSLSPETQAVLRDLMLSAALLPSPEGEDAADPDAPRHRQATAGPDAMPCGGECPTFTTANRLSCAGTAVAYYCPNDLYESYCHPFSFSQRFCPSSSGGTTWSSTPTSTSTSTSRGGLPAPSSSQITYGLPTYGSPGSPSSWMYDITGAGQTSINTGRSGANCQLSYNSFGYQTCNNTWGF